MIRPRLGQLVTSKAGRDQGREFLIVGFSEDGLLVADGDMRKMSNPKKKNFKHLWFRNEVALDVAAKLERGEAVTDEEIRGALRRLATSARGGG